MRKILLIQGFLAAVFVTACTDYVQQMDEIYEYLEKRNVDVLSEKSMEDDTADVLVIDNEDDLIDSMGHMRRSKERFQISRRSGRGNECRN